METGFLARLVGEEIEHYRLEQLSGSGPAYAIYRARQQSSQRLVTLTLLSPPPEMPAEVRQRFRAQFLEEMPTLAEMQHKHLVPLSGFGEWRDWLYVMMPFAPGEALATLVGQQGGATPAMVLTVLEQVTAGLEYAHCQGIVHGALTPSHLVVSQKRRVGIVGMGLLSLLQRYDLLPLAVSCEHACLVPPTDFWTVNPKYLAPECLEREAVADIRSDVYSLGCILQDLLTGTLPCVGAQTRGTARQQSELPRPLVRVLQRALAVDPRERFRRVSDLLTAFAEGLAEVGASNPQISSSFPTMQAPPPEDAPPLVSRSYSQKMANVTSSAEISSPASRSQAPQSSKPLPALRQYPTSGGRMRESRSRRMSRRRLLSRITKGAAVGALSVSGISIGYLLSTAPLKPPLVRKNPLPQVPNTAQIFTNPHNGREGLFIRLPNGKLVAYDRACTHRGVYVDYDEKTHMLVCPAHEAIFDPAHGARVVQGPATVPLPAVPFHVKDDGTLLIGESEGTSREDAL